MRSCQIIQTGGRVYDPGEKVHLLGPVGSLTSLRSSLRPGCTLSHVKYIVGASFTLLLVAPFYNQDYEHQLQKSDKRSNFSLIKSDML